MALNKGQQRVVAQAKAWMAIDPANLYHSVAAMLSGEIRMARKDSQKRELHVIAVELGVHTHPKYIIQKLGA
jgi:hypothetical protein